VEVKVVEEKIRQGLKEENVEEEVVVGNVNKV
jgi:hypothetical protein